MNARLRALTTGGTAAAAEVDWAAVYAEQLPRVINYFRFRVGDEALVKAACALHEKAVLAPSGALARLRAWGRGADRGGDGPDAALAAGWSRRLPRLAHGERPASVAGRD